MLRTTRQPARAKAAGAVVGGVSMTSKGPSWAPAASTRRRCRCLAFHQRVSGGRGAGDQAMASWPRSRRAAARARAVCAAPSSAARGGWLTMRILNFFSAAGPGQYDVAHYQAVHAGAQEAVEGLGRSIDDGLVLIE